MGGIVATGDSYVEPGAAQVRFLSEALREPVSARGRRGWTLERWRRSGDLSGAARGATTVLIHLGGNAPTHRPETIRLLDSQARSEGAQVYWIPPPIWPRASPVYARGVSMRKALRQAGVVRLGSAFVPMRGDLAADRVHLTRQGARRWAFHLSRAVYRGGLLALGTALGLLLLRGLL